MGVRRRRPVLTMRDERIYTSLYVATVLSTEQIARMYFPSALDPEDLTVLDPEKPSKHSAEERLSKLVRYDYLLTDSAKLGPKGPKVKYWTLPKRMYRREAEGLGNFEESHPGLPKRLAHHLKTNDLYAAIHRHLEEIFEDTPGWQWQNERHSHREYNYAGKDGVHRPDAEIHFPDGRVFFVERQTADSRKTAEVYKDRARRYRIYMEYLGMTDGEAKLLFACDVQRDMDHAYEACEEMGVEGMVTDPEDAADYIIERAKE